MRLRKINYVGEEWISKIDLLNFMEAYSLAYKDEIGYPTGESIKLLIKEIASIKWDKEKC